MTLEQALLKIIELQDKILDLERQLNARPAFQPLNPIPYINTPFVYTDTNLCFDGGNHQYPNPWGGTTSPHCQKCGKQAYPSFTITSNSGEIKATLNS